jgi:APA family basic amino acid/polyamine antiporter
VTDIRPLVRPLGVIACTALVMGNMIGSGIFLLPASLAPYGWNGVAGWIVTIGGSLALAYCIARLAAIRSERQDPPGLVEAAFGRTTGFAVGWSYWVSIWTANAAISIAGVSYLSLFFPALKHPGMGAAVAIALVWLVTFVNLAGARAAGGLQVVTLLLKLMPLAAVLIIAAWALGTGHAPQADFSPSGLKFESINAAAALTLWAMLGFESAACVAAKARDPQRTVPRATIIGTLATGLLYLLVCTAITQLLPASVVQGSDAPFADFVSHFIGWGPAYAVGAFAAISAIGALNGWTLLQGEIPLAMAQRGELPAWFARTDARGTPARALVFSSVLISLLLVINSLKTLSELFVFMILLSTSAALWMYLGCAAAALRLRVAMPVAALGTAYALWTLWGAGLNASALSLLLMIAGLPVYYWSRRAAQPGEGRAGSRA